MTVPIEKLREFVRQCDPLVPLTAGDPRYTPLDEVRGTERGCVDALENALNLREPEAETRFLFTGFPGTGKTTELRRLERRLLDDASLSTRVVFVDFDEWVDRYSPVCITDVLRVLAFCLDRAALIAEGRNPDREPGYAHRFWDFLTRTELEFKNLQFEAYGASLMLELRNNPSFYRLAEQLLATRFQAFATQAHDAMSEAVVRLRKATGARRVVVLADSLEKLTPVREADRKDVEASVERLFVQHAEMLKLPCHAIYSFPLWLRFKTAELGARFDAAPFVLPMVKVTEPGGAPSEPGIGMLADLVGRRIDATAIFGDGGSAALRQIILASGGYPRDLLRLVRETLAAPTFPVAPGGVKRVIERLEAEYGNVVRGANLDVLAQVARDHSMPVGDAAIADFGRLVDRFLVLAHTNGHEWFDLHPLVRRHKLLTDRLRGVLL